MMKEGLVSIIMPAYNSAGFIEESIKSVLLQSYSNWELIVVDDCSTDNTYAIVESYARTDDRIRLYKTEFSSGGPTEPRNIALSKARGSYVAFLDSDDIWYKDKLSHQYSFSEANGYDIVYSYYEKIDWSGKRKNRIVRTDGSYDYDKLLESDGIPWLTVMIKREVIKSVCLRMINKEDYVFLLDILRQGYVAHNTKTVEAMYREQPGSRSGNKLVMAMEQWHIIRDYEHVGLLKAVKCISVYACKGIAKYLI